VPAGNQQEEHMVTTQAQATTSDWKVDKTHSNVDFSVKHLMISTVRGHFREFEAEIYVDEALPENSRVSATIHVASVDTNLPDRDAHLRSDDFFNAEQFPSITFESTSVEVLDASDFRVAGNLTIRDVTRPVVLNGEYDGRIVDPWGNERIAFNAETEISRKDFNVRWNQLLETGGVTVSDTVKIRLYVEAIRQAAEDSHFHVGRVAAAN
jgi:polyisoprenoid-binding protein YceI